MTAIPTTRYVRSDDVHVAYQVIGDGPLDLLWVPGYVSHVEAAWHSPQHAAFIRRLASFCRLILFDKRGTGMSDRGSQIFTLEQRMHDVHAILDEIGSERAALFGVSEGGPMSLLYAATYPERTSALVLYGSYAKRSWAPDYPFGWKDEQWERVLANIDQNWGTPQGTNLAMYAPSLMDKPDAAEQVASYFRASASPGAAAAIMKMNREIDVRNVLPAVHAPTMIIHRTGDRVSEVGHARYMAQQIAGAKLVELPGIDHAYWLDGGKVILDQIEQFLTGGLHAHEVGADARDRAVCRYCGLDRARRETWRWSVARIARNVPSQSPRGTAAASRTRDQVHRRWFPRGLRRPRARNSLCRRNPGRRAPARARGPLRPAHRGVRDRR